MYYKVPETKPIRHEKPKPIFPWEERALPPSRVFTEELIPGSGLISDYEQDELSATLMPLAKDKSTQEVLHTDEISMEADKDPPKTTERPTAVESDEPWPGFARASNVWDYVPGINTYVRAVKVSQERPKSISVSGIGNVENLNIQPFREDDAQEGASLIITDFPTEIERPSLPVTPAPIQRVTFWGDEREASIALPPAEGVPSQADWVCSCPRCGFSSSIKLFSPYSLYASSTASNRSPTPNALRASNPIQKSKTEPSTVTSTSASPGVFGLLQYGAERKTVTKALKLEYIVIFCFQKLAL